MAASRKSVGMYSGNTVSVTHCARCAGPVGSYAWMSPAIGACCSEKCAHGPRKNPAPRKKKAAAKRKKKKIPTLRLHRKTRSNSPRKKATRKASKKRAAQRPESRGKSGQGTPEAMIHRARQLLQYVAPKQAMARLVADGAPREYAYLAVKAAMVMDL